MRLLRGSACCVVMSACCLFFMGCGATSATGGGAASPVKTTQFLNGTWHLFGDDKQLLPNSVADGPALSVGVGVSAKGEAYARGMFVPRCGASAPSSLGIVLNGKVDSDGNLRLSEISSRRLTITVTSWPGAEGANWIGSYSFDFPAGSVCTDRATGSGTFAATRLPSATGTYTGTIDRYYPSAGSSMAISAVLEQSQNSAVDNRPYVDVPYPVLRGTITVSTPTCTLTGSTMFAAEHGGDYAEIPFNMSDGSTLFVDAAFPIDGRTTLQALVGIENTTCKGGYYGTLTRK